MAIDGYGWKELNLLVVRLKAQREHVCMYVCMCFYGAYNYSGLVRQVSGFGNVSVSALGTCFSLDCWI